MWDSGPAMKPTGRFLKEAFGLCTRRPPGILAADSCARLAQSLVEAAREEEGRAPAPKHGLTIASRAVPHDYLKNFDCAAGQRLALKLRPDCPQTSWPTFPRCCAF
jgi:hypothetical protein